jgi:uncharacterized membrane protein YraQ (UPF0718 family)
VAEISVEHRVRAFAPLILDVVAPIVGYYALRAGGVGEVAAFAVTGVATGTAAVAVSLRRRTLDTVKTLVCLELALSLALTIAVDDPRVAAVRPAGYLLIAGGYFLLSCWVGKPVLYVTATPMATHGGDPVRTRAYEWAWPNSKRFRSHQRMLTGSVGAVMFLDSALRVLIVFSYPPDQVDASFLYSNAAGVVMIALIAALMIFFVRRASRYIDAVVADMNADSTAFPGV